MSGLCRILGLACGSREGLKDAEDTAVGKHCCSCCYYCRDDDVQRLTITVTTARLLLRQLLLLLLALPLLLHFYCVCSIATAPTQASDAILLGRPLQRLLLTYGCFYCYHGYSYYSYDSPSYHSTPTTLAPTRTPMPTPTPFAATTVVTTTTTTTVAKTAWRSPRVS